MAKREVFVYLLLGFLESGKTSIITEFIEKAKFRTNEKSLIIACEEGEEEYDPKFLKEANTDIVYIEKEEELTTEFIAECDAKYKPDKVYIEMNGMWILDLFNRLAFPDTWVAMRNIALVDASQFELQFNNIKEYMMMHFRAADFIIFNRCNEAVKQSSIKRIVKMVNPEAQLAFESVDGKLSIVQNEELPFDINKPLIEVS
ncbi:GTP-binding protein [Cellulosilyticum ruminicola]|uniref:GTP-binding protein n=1 Tax=Cellulosilyticum ruminicola TaxID=425254 RepID=UPI0006D13A77|nr:GTP-binding protein [Cellulosilyticum ruminicola]